MTKHINIDTVTNSELEDIFNSYIRVDMAERIDCESAIEEIAKLINKQIIEARIDELECLSVGVDDSCVDEWKIRLNQLRTTK